MQSLSLPLLAIVIIPALLAFAGSAGLLQFSRKNNLKISWPKYLRDSMIAGLVVMLVVLGIVKGLDIKVSYFMSFFLPPLLLCSGCLGVFALKVWQFKRNYR